MALRDDNDKWSDSSQNLSLPLRDIVPEYYSRSSLVRWLFTKRLSVAADYVRRIAPDALLDLGCGDGSFLNFLSQQSVHVNMLWGVDLNPAVESLRAKIPSCSFANRNLFETGFPDHTFDAVVCLDVLEHIRNLSCALTEVRRNLKVDGWLITSEPVESLLYRSLRFVLKGSYSRESGPGAGPHYFNARQIDRSVRDAGFVRHQCIMIPLPFPFDLFHVNLYRVGAQG